MKENEEQVRNTQSNEKENKKIRKMQENEENASRPFCMVSELFWNDSLSC